MPQVASQKSGKKDPALATVKERKGKKYCTLKNFTGRQDLIIINGKRISKDFFAFVTLPGGAKLSPAPLLLQPPPPLTPLKPSLKDLQKHGGVKLPDY